MDCRRIHDSYRSATISWKYDPLGPDCALLEVLSISCNPRYKRWSRSKLRISAAIRQKMGLSSVFLAEHRRSTSTFPLSGCCLHNLGTQ